MNKPVFVLVAGINGAGKSTFAQSPGALAQLPPLTLINPDLLNIALPRRCPAVLRYLTAGLIPAPEL